MAIHLLTCTHALVLAVTEGQIHARLLLQRLLNINKNRPTYIYIHVVYLMKLENPYPTVQIMISWQLWFSHIYIYIHMTMSENISMIFVMLFYTTTRFKKFGHLQSNKRAWLCRLPQKVLVTLCCTWDNETETKTDIDSQHVLM